MRKYSKIFATVLAGLMVCLLTFGTVGMDAKASDSLEERVCIDGSYLIGEEFSEGQIELLPRGTYLKSGSSRISNAGAGKVTVNGKTTGQEIVSTIKVGVRLQKLDDGVWKAYRYWSASDTDSAYVSLTKTISVDKGYYYRVYSTHSAGGDVSSSFTNGIFID